MEQEKYGVSILMPCLNEKMTIGYCVDRAQSFLKAWNLPGEVLVADNASTDDSAIIAKKEGARVVHVKRQGYGIALATGISAARYPYVLMLDADASYDVFDGKALLDKLDEGYDLVVGNRFDGGIEKGAMPFLHRYIGNPVLSAIGRSWSHTDIGDFHCGLRAFRKECVEGLNLQTTQMEFASEMIMKGAKNDLRITELPCRLYCDKREGKSHLRTVRDGIRHLICLWENRRK